MFQNIVIHSSTLYLLPIGSRKASQKHIVLFILSFVFVCIIIATLNGFAACVVVVVVVLLSHSPIADKC